MSDVDPRTGLAARLEESRANPAFRNYEKVRSAVLAMLAASASPSGEARPSEYWEEELAGFEYMLDASPLIVEKLRHHTYHATGLKVYDYRTHKDKAKAQFSQKLDALIEAGGRELLVPESPKLGGFGHEIGEELFNVDTLKFYEALIALDRGAVLKEFRETEERRLVLEIGGGWGGFAYQFKTLCPNTTYVIIDLPQLFLFSATYLMTHFPEARVGFLDGTGDGPTDGDWTDYDFVFVPHTSLDVVRPSRLDLTVNMVSFQEMTTEQVRAYISHVYELGCPFLYSLNRERSLYNPELSGVSGLLEEFYWPHEIEVLPVSYTRMLDGAPKASIRNRLRSLKRVASPKSNMDYRHLIGWRRVAT